MPLPNLVKLTKQQLIEVCKTVQAKSSNRLTRINKYKAIILKQSSTHFNVEKIRSLTEEQNRILNNIKYLPYNDREEHKKQFKDTELQLIKLCINQIWITYSAISHKIQPLSYNASKFVQEIQDITTIIRSSMERLSLILPECSYKELLNENITDINGLLSLFHKKVRSDTIVLPLSSYDKLLLQYMCTDEEQNFLNDSPTCYELTEKRNMLYHDNSPLVPYNENVRPDSCCFYGTINELIKCVLTNCVVCVEPNKFYVLTDIVENKYKWQYEEYLVNTFKSIIKHILSQAVTLFKTFYKAIFKHNNWVDGWESRVTIVPCWSLMKALLANIKILSTDAFIRMVCVAVVKERKYEFDSTRDETIEPSYYDENFVSLLKKVKSGIIPYDDFNEWRFRCFDDLTTRKYDDTNEDYIWNDWYDNNKSFLPC